MSTADLVLAHLQAFGLKGSGNKYRSRSPLRPDSDSDSFSLTITDGEHGTFKDFGGNESGSLYKLAKLLGIDTPSAGQRGGDLNSTKRAYKGLADYALAHGVEAKVFMEAGWREAQYAGKLALRYPTRTGDRWRIIDGSKQPYGNQKGYKSCWYGLERAVKLLQPQQPLVLCNGEASVVVAQHFGVAAICLTNGERDIPLHLVEELRVYLGDSPPAILITLDCDTKGQETARLIESNLNLQGFSVAAIDLGLFHNGDLADFCALHQQEAPQALLKLPLLPSQPALDPTPLQRTWTIVSRDYLKTLPPVRWLVENELQEGALNVMFGRSGGGKSFLAIDYVGQVARHSKVIYMAGEGEYDLDARFAAWERHHSHSLSQNVSICLGSVELIDTGDLEAFLAEIQPLQPALVVVDTMSYAMIAGDENSSRDMKMFVEACRKIRMTVGCAVLLIHHTNKQGHEERGSNVLRGAADCMVKVTKEDEFIRIDTDKVKAGKDNTQRYARLVEVQVARDDKLLESAVLVPAEKVMDSPTDSLSKGQLKILEYLDIEGEEMQRKELEELTGLDLSTLKRAITKLKKLGYVEQPAYGLYKITPAGQTALYSGSSGATGSGGAEGQEEKRYPSAQIPENSEPLEPHDPLIRPLWDDVLPSGQASYYADGG